MGTPASAAQSATALLAKHGPLVRFSDALALGIHRDTLRTLREEGLLEQVSRGLYRLASRPALEHLDLVVLSARVPGAVVCLVSALALHGLTTQIPHAVDLALKHGRKRPRVDYPPMRTYWWSSAALEEGIEHRDFGGVKVLVTNPERSVADLFRYRNKLGLDLAVEALRAWRERKGARPEKLLAAAKAVRADRIIQPYLQAVR